MLTKKQQSKIIEILKPYRPTKIGVFGSVARNEENDQSDIDLLYQIETPIGILTAECIRKEIQSQLNKKIDFVSFNAISEWIKDDVLEDVIIFYETPKNNK
ncbi:MAG: nucleotidyltransferase domain-containing protein [Flavobacteriaceae bacterium]|nr:nucleotidyltransferase domain-containing protein [Flavobacteriaceae bacterium]